MTAISHVYNYTVRCPHIKDPSHPTSWLNHIEINHSCEISLDRITKWHNHSGTRVFEYEGFTVRESEQEGAYFSLQSDRFKEDFHTLVTVKIHIDKATKNASVQEIMQHIIRDYHVRLSKI
ncbi:cytoplasmic protein [Shewanella surugensis]|uniref:Cytoplasmic protein n=1 Tax=Shewanella surugensis TaxID=212020 RepID=A0ABT0LBV9_9GAMM|nr:cytoplasmic protein [Shewanella surugensis]MCL1124686.1 cytoplasmic protein [Shewanella surugensis]